jgi:transcriptional regulator with XRE-family HTH domain
MNKSPSEADRRIGERLRASRVALGLSQEKLGEALGVTFQQVQKYEKGSNRMGAGRLQQAARVLGVPVAAFYDDGPDDPTAGGAREGACFPELSTEEAALLSAYRRVGDAKLRKRIQQLVQAMASG